MTFLILTISFAAIVAWGSASSASRYTLAILRTKIILVCIVFFAILAALAGWRWFIGDEDLSGLTLMLWPLAAIGMLVCLSSVAGMLFASYQRRNRC